MLCQATKKNGEPCSYKANCGEFCKRHSKSSGYADVNTLPPPHPDLLKSHNKKSITIYNNDCFSIFPKVQDKSVDLFVLDLPYATKEFGKCTDCKWDTPIDLEKMWVEIKRMMKPTAVILFFCNIKLGCSLVMSNPKWFRYDLVWEKSIKVGFLQANKMPMRKHENIFVFGKGWGTYNPQKTKGKPYTARNSERKDLGVYGGTSKSYVNENKGDRHPPSILSFNNPSKSFHRTQKPTDMLEWLIKSYSNEGDTVMDFTMGSGSTGVACVNTKRKFIGVERDTDIFKIAEYRIL